METDKAPAEIRKEEEAVKMNKTKLRLAIRLMLELTGNVRDYEDGVPVNPANYYEATLSSIRMLTTTHRWTDALHIIPHLMEWVVDYPLVIWKVGILVMMNSAFSSPELIKKFVNTLITVSRLYHREILLEHVEYLIETRDYYEAQRFIDENIFRKPLKRQMSYMVGIYNGYRAVIDFIQWNNKRNQLDGTQGVAGNQQTVIHLKSEIYTHCERAINYLSEMCRYSGNLDPYIQTYVTLLESKEEFEKAEEVLGNYTKSNPKHPSAYDFYYKFLQTHSLGDNELQIKLLKKLLKLNPTDSRLLILVDMLPEEEFEERLKILLNAIDHVECRNDVNIWRKLALVLTNEAQSLSDCHHVFLNSIWEDRKSWWPAYHFRNSNVNIDSAESAELLVSKALVIATFYKPEHNFIVATNKELKLKVVKDDANKLDDALEIVKSLNLKECKNSSNCTELLNMEKSKKKNLRRPKRISTIDTKKKMKEKSNNEPPPEELKLEESVETPDKEEPTEKSEKKAKAKSKKKTKAKSKKKTKAKSNEKAKAKDKTVTADKEEPTQKSEKKTKKAKSKKKKAKSETKTAAAISEKENRNSTVRKKHARKVVSKRFVSSSSSSSETEDNDINAKETGEKTPLAQDVNRELGYITISSSGRDDDDKTRNASRMSSAGSTKSVVEITDSSSSEEFTSKINEPSTSSGIKRYLVTKTLKLGTKKTLSSKISKHRKSDSRLLKKVGNDFVWVEKELLNTPLSENGSNLIRDDIAVKDSRQRR